MRCVVSCSSTSFPWLVFFFGALLWGSVIHKHTGKWMWQRSNISTFLMTCQHSGNSLICFFLLFFFFNPGCMHLLIVFDLSCLVSMNSPWVCLAFLVLCIYHVSFSSYHVQSSQYMYLTSLVLYFCNVSSFLILCLHCSFLSLHIRRHTHTQNSNNKNF